MNSKVNSISKPVKALALSALLSLILMFSRIFLTGNFTYIFLSWNLFLAWVPLVMAIFIRKLHLERPHRFSRITFWPLFALWLLFFPNAPYLVTDLVHQSEALGNKPHKLCIYSSEPHTEAYCLRLNFNISKLVYLLVRPAQVALYREKSHCTFASQYLASQHLYRLEVTDM